MLYRLEQGHSLVGMLGSLGAYSRLPRRLEHLYYEAPPDIYGVEDRLNVIEATLHGRSLGELADLGGNSGYFCLSILDAGMANRATVYDVSVKALAAGRLMAKEMSLSRRIDFVNQPVCLEFLRKLRGADTIICLNLLHHAGAKFDVERVLQQGWENYAKEWLCELRNKCRIAILGLGFKQAEPRYWKVPHNKRAALFGQFAEDCGWSILYEANVKDINKRGVDAANRFHTIERADSWLMEKIARGIRRMADIRPLLLRRHFDRRRDYHIYILEQSRA
jgi:hypothetical protein